MKYRYIQSQYMPRKAQCLVVAQIYSRGVLSQKEVAEAEILSLSAKAMEILGVRIGWTDASAST